MVRNLDHRLALLEAQVESLLKAEYIPLNENLRIREEQAKQFTHFQRHIATLSGRLDGLCQSHTNLAESFERHKNNNNLPQDNDFPVLARLMDELSADDRTKVYMYASALRTLAERRGQA